MNAKFQRKASGLKLLGKFFILLVGLASSGSFANEGIEDSNPFVHFIRGQISAPVKATLAASMTGKITVFDVQEGDTVDVSSQLITFDCSVPNARYELLVAETKAAEKQYEVSQRLHEFKNISELDVALAQADRDIALAKLTESKLTLSRCLIQAPFSGVVIAKHVYQHEHVNEGDPLLDLISQSSLEIEMLVPATHINDFKKGTTVTMALDDSGQQVRAKMTRIVPVIDPVSQMVKAFATIETSGNRLIPGMTGNIRQNSER